MAGQKKLCKCVGVISYKIRNFLESRLIKSYWKAN